MYYVYKTEYNLDPELEPTEYKSNDLLEVAVYVYSYEKFPSNRIYQIVQSRYIANIAVNGTYISYNPKVIEINTLIELILLKQALQKAVNKYNRSTLQRIINSIALLDGDTYNLCGKLGITRLLDLALKTASLHENGKIYLLTAFSIVIAIFAILLAVSGDNAKIRLLSIVACAAIGYVTFSNMK